MAAAGEEAGAVEEEPEAAVALSVTSAWIAPMEMRGCCQRWGWKAAESW